MNKIILIIIIAINGILFAKTKNYRVYHIYINEAERYFFINNQVDSSLFFYDKAFNEFEEFVFVKDVVNAIQIAYFKGKDYKKYIILGFKYGLKFEHLKEIKLFKASSYENILKDKNLKQIYIQNRKKYIQNINISMLLSMYKLTFDDQIAKLRKDYNAIKKNNMKSILALTKKYGFPSEKNIGINDKTIFVEKGYHDKDFYNQRNKYGKKLNYLTLDENELSSKFVILLLIHNECSFLELDSLFSELIIKGEIHPREVGLIYDNMFRDVNDNNYNCIKPKAKDGVFLLNIFTYYDNIGVTTDVHISLAKRQGYSGNLRNGCCKNGFITREMVDKKRQALNIVPLIIDDKKAEYEKKYGFKLFWGFWSCM